MKKKVSSIHEGVVYYKNSKKIDYNSYHENCIFIKIETEVPFLGVVVFDDNIIVKSIIRITTHDDREKLNGLVTKFVERNIIVDSKIVVSYRCSCGSRITNVFSFDESSKVKDTYRRKHGGSGYETYDFKSFKELYL